ncbi:uncharacterized protein LOC123295484 [Chrysoperla carnea]|uniref:uncharacterized protein LOC123295484 n=1 Tax=Chrysoperla carnea TaxID=189513 RepID=UPI001D05FBE3|nr:uncharacterized protein LOC123295484 [Chrysoperla carnea]
MGLLQKYLFIALIGGCTINLFYGLPMVPENNGEDFDEQDSGNLTNSTGAQDLYVIRAVVYEVGILTNATSSEEDSSDSDEEVDLSFFRQHHNGSVIDLSNIPTPIQTNISGKAITGIAPINFGTFAAPANNQSNASLVVLQNNNTVPIAIPNAVISVTSNFSTKTLGTQQDILSNIAPLLPATINSTK